MTHLQHAQPVLLAHQLLAHVHAFEPRRRPAARLGPRAAALARSAPARWPARRCRWTRTRSPRELGFDAAVRQLDRRRRPTATSRPSSCFVAALIGVHLSRLGEEIVPLGHAGVRLGRARRRLRHRVVDHAAEEEPGRRRAGPRQVRPADRQPDRRCSTTLKGLPLAYDRDLQEDKEPVFDAVDTLLLVLPAVAGHGRDDARPTPSGMAAAAPAGLRARHRRRRVAGPHGRAVPRRARDRRPAGAATATSTASSSGDLDDDELADVDPHLTPEVRAVLVGPRRAARPARPTAAPRRCGSASSSPPLRDAVARARGLGDR